jgi:hypothetical protein
MMLMSAIEDVRFPVVVVRALFLCGLAAVEAGSGRGRGGRREVDKAEPQKSRDTMVGQC